VFLKFGEHGLDTDGRVDTHRANCPEQPDLEALLIRPDGHTAWISTTADAQAAETLATAVATWFGVRTGHCGPAPR